MFTLSAEDSSYTVTFENGFILAAHAQVSILGRAGEKEKVFTLAGMALSGDGKSISASFPMGNAVLSFEEKENGIEISCSASIPGSFRKILLLPVAGVRLEHATHLLSHGRTMGGCKTCRLPAKTLQAELGESEGNSFQSFFQTVVTFGRRHLHITQPLRQSNISWVQGTVNGDAIENLAAVTCFEFAAPGNLAAEKTAISFPDDAFRALCEWGAGQSEAGISSTPEPAGWNTWDYYRWTITEEEVLKNADFIASDPVLGKHVRRIIIDDGWQYCYGEWDANPLFPSGMKGVADKISKMGFTPGLWIAPLIAEPHSRIAQWDTDMLAMSEGGDPCLAYECMRRYGFILDPTVEKCRKFWFDLFDRYSGYGYGYFKIDFLMPLFNAPRFHDSGVPRGELLRMALKPIACGVNGRARILGCGYAYEAGNDLVGMVRAGGDIHATWGNAKANAVSVAARAWASGRLWTTDPDFCVCRGPETSADPDLGRLRCLYVFVKPEETARGLALDYPWSHGLDTILAREAQCLLSIALMNGGAINLSDKLYRLNSLGLDMIRKTVSAQRGEAAIPVDLFESDIASKWIQRIPGGVRALLVNWSDEESELSVDLGALGVNLHGGRNFWNGEEVRAPGGMLRAALKPHSCLLAEFEK